MYTTAACLYKCWSVCHSLQMNNLHCSNNNKMNYYVAVFRPHCGSSVYPSVPYRTTDQCQCQYRIYIAHYHEASLLQKQKKIEKNYFAVLIPQDESHHVPIFTSKIKDQSHRTSKTEKQKANSCLLTAAGSSAGGLAHCTLGMTQQAGTNWMAAQNVATRPGNISAWFQQETSLN